MTGDRQIVHVRHVDLTTVDPRTLPQEVQPIAITAQESEKVMSLLDSYQKIKTLADSMIASGETATMIDDMEVKRSEIILGVFVFGILADEHLQTMKAAAKTINKDAPRESLGNSDALTRAEIQAGIADTKFSLINPLCAEGSLLPMETIAKYPTGSQEARTAIDAVFRDLEELSPADARHISPYLSYLIQSRDISTYEKDTPDIIKAKLLTGRATERIAGYLHDYFTAWHDIQTGRTSANDYDEQLLPTRSKLMASSVVENMIFHPDIAPWTAARYMQELNPRFPLEEAQALYTSHYHEHFGHAFELKADIETEAYPYMLAQQTYQQKKTEGLVTKLLETTSLQDSTDDFARIKADFRKITKRLQAEDRGSEYLLTLDSLDENIDYITISCMSDTLLDIIVVGKDGKALLMHVDKEGRVIGGFPTEFNTHKGQTRAEALFTHILPHVIRGLEEKGLIPKPKVDSPSTSSGRRTLAAPQPTTLLSRKERIALHAAGKKAKRAEEAAAQQAQSGEEATPAPEFTVNFPDDDKTPPELRASIESYIRAQATSENAFWEIATAPTIQDDESNPSFVISVETVIEHTEEGTQTRLVVKRLWP